MAELMSVSHGQNTRVAFAQTAHSRARTAFTPRRRELFLELIAKGATIAEAAEAAEVGRRTVYDARRRDAEFSLRWDLAIEISCDVYLARLRDLALSAKADIAVPAAELFLRARHPAFRR